MLLAIWRVQKRIEKNIFHFLQQATGDEKFSRVVRDIIEYATRDLKHPLNGFFSGEDADSLPTANAEHKQGKYYRRTKNLIVVRCRNLNKTLFCVVFLFR